MGRHKSTKVSIIQANYHLVFIPKYRKPVLTGPVVPRIKEIWSDLSQRNPFDVVIAPQEIPIGPPTEYHSSFLAMMQTNRAIYPIAKIVIYMNLFFGGATNWPIFFLKVFMIYLFSAFVGVVFPRFRIEQTIRWFLIWALPLGILAIVLV